MSKPSEAHLEIARRLLAQHRAAGGGGEEAAAAGRVYDGLFGSLAPVIGEAGFRALFRRSVKLTSREHPHLNDLLAEPVQSDEHVARQLVDCLGRLSPATVSEVAPTLYATLFTVMSSLIGERLVAQLVQRAFPAAEEPGPEVTE